MKNSSLFFLLVLSLAFLNSGYSQNLPMSQLPALVTVTGTAKLYTEPDEVHFTININTEGQDLLAAKQENAALAGKAIKYLRSQGVEERHIQTQYLNVSVQYRNREKTSPRYIANQSIKVCLLDVSKFEEVNIGLLKEGITGINGPNFKSSKQEELLDKARLKAVVDAREKAEALANELGQQIGPAYSITDVQNNGGGNLVYGRAMAMDMESSAGPSIAIGELSVSHSVTVAFHLLPQ